MGQLVLEEELLQVAVLRVCYREGTWGSSQICGIWKGFMGERKDWLLPVCGCVERGWIALDECASREAVCERGILYAQIFLYFG